MIFIGLPPVSTSTAASVVYHDHKFVAFSFMTRSRQRLTGSPSLTDSIISIKVLKLDTFSICPNI